MMMKRAAIGLFATLTLVASIGAAFCQGQPVVPVVNGLAVSTANPMPVTPISGGTAQNVNITQVAGSPVQTGHGTAAGSIRVELPTDGTGVVSLNAGSNIIGKVSIDQTTPGTTNGVQVNAALPAGSNGIGQVGGYEFQVAPTVTVQNAAYAAGNSEGGLITVTGAARTNGGAGIWMNSRIKSKGASNNTIWIYAWSKTPASTCTDKSAFVLSDTDSPYAIPGFPQSVTLGGAPGAWDTATYAQLQGINSNFKNQDSSPGTAIYLCLVTAGSVTPATTSDLTMVANGIQD